MKKVAILKVAMFVSLFFGLQFEGNADNLNSVPAHILNTQDLEKTYEWSTFKTFSGITIEYKYLDCNTVKTSNLSLVVFRFKNTTNKNLKISWSTELWRDGKCVNEDKLDSEEYSFDLKLKPNEVVEGDCTRSDAALYVASHFIKLSPGMSGTTLSDVKFKNVQVEPWK